MTTVTPDRSIEDKPLYQVKRKGETKKAQICFSLRF
jgi:hypothetical protein